MKKIKRVACAAAALGVGLFGAAETAWALNGICTLTPLQVQGTEGFSASGTALATSAFAPVGPFAQAGTVSHVVDSFTVSSISGRWSVTLTQTDSSGVPKQIQFGGNYTLNTNTCTNDLTLTNPAALAAIAGPRPVFREIWVGNGDELRTIALIPNVIITYTTAKKL